MTTISRPPRRYQFCRALLVVATVVALFGYAPIQAQFTRQLTYQGVLKDNTGALVNGTVTVRFILWDALTGGTSLGGENKLVTVKNGLFSTTIGSGGLLVPATAFKDDYWLEIEYPVGTPLAPRTPLTPAPYSMRARIADSVVGGNGSTLWEINVGNARLLSPNTTAPVLIGAGTAPTTPGRLNVAGNTADNATLRIVPPSSATTPQTILLSDGVNTSSGAATGISLGTIQTATGGPSTGMYIDNVITGGGGANGIRLPNVTSTSANAWGLRLSLVEASGASGTATGIELSAKSANGAAFGVDAVANSANGTTSYGVRSNNTSVGVGGTPQYGVWGEVGTAPTGAGVYARGAGTIPLPLTVNAAALEINNGQIRITGAAQAAGIVPIPWPLPIGGQCVVGIANPLVTATSRILITTEPVLPPATPPGTPTNIFIASVSNIVPGGFDVSYIQMGPGPICAGAPALVAPIGMNIHYIILGP